jgi:hypothetical protein
MREILCVHKVERPTKIYIAMACKFHKPAAFSGQSFEAELYAGGDYTFRDEYSLFAWSRNTGAIVEARAYLQ